jgi:hypothetical protein
MGDWEDMFSDDDNSDVGVAGATMHHFTDAQLAEKIKSVVQTVLTVGVPLAKEHACYELIMLPGVLAQRGQAQAQPRR